MQLYSSNRKKIQLLPDISFFPTSLLWHNPAAAQHYITAHSLPTWDKGEDWKQNRTCGSRKKPIY